MRLHPRPKLLQIVVFEPCDLLPKRGGKISIQRANVNGLFTLMMVYFASSIRLEPEERGAGPTLQPLVSGHHALCHAVAQREQHRRDQLWLGFHHILEYLGRHEQQIARDLRQNIGGPQGSSLEPLPAWPPGGSKRGIFTAARSWENRTRMTRAWLRRRSPRRQPQTSCRSGHRLARYRCTCRRSGSPAR